MPESASHRQFCRTHLRFALLMLIVALLAGISFQESGRKVLVTAEVPAGAHLEFILSLALVHGHLVVMGVLLPLAFTWMLHLAGVLGLGTVPPRALAWGTRLYLPGVCLTSLLMLVKGYHLVLGVRHGHTDFAALNASFLGGSHALRVAAFGFAHALMGGGLVLLAWAFWKALGSRQAA
ncbi:hypothetical protein [Mesoterricola sediminis]|uniref:hypothetical protein n=1 Tax=Mesoterricola sediminis TaxID=2927980 RepID=UPI001FAEB923|nr:hypothetical protein [Mesoterricola sediminis]